MVRDGVDRCGLFDYWIPFRIEYFIFLAAQSKEWRKKESNDSVYFPTRIAPILIRSCLEAAI